MTKDFLRNTLLIGGAAFCLLFYKYLEGELNVNAGSVIAGLVLLPIVSFGFTIGQKSRAKSLANHQRRLRRSQKRSS